MRNLTLLALLAMACVSCQESEKTDVATMRPTPEELDPTPKLACVTVNTGNGTYTVDGSGCVPS